MKDPKDNPFGVGRGPRPQVRGVAVVRNAEGLIKCDMPDGSIKLVTDEEWPEVRRLQQEAAAENDV